MRAIFTVIFLGISAVTIAQEWTIKQCIDTALVRNTKTQQTAIDIQVTNNTIQQKKYAFLPSINSAATHGYNWGQTIDPFTNQFATNRVQSNNFYLYGSLTLFSGLQNYYGLKMESLSHQSQVNTHEIESRNIKVQVTTAYLQVLLNTELVDVAESHLKLTQHQKDRVIKLIEAGQNTQSALNDILAKEAEDKYNLLKAKNDRDYALMVLQQLLNRPYDTSFKVQILDFEVAENGVVEVKDVQRLPEIENANLTIEKQYVDIKNAKALMYPNLSLSGSIGSGYSGNNKFENSNGELQPKPFSDQLNENFYQQVYVSLSIPIFNNNYNRSQVKIKELELEKQYLEKEKQITELTNALQKLKFDITNYFAEYTSVLAVESAAQLNFDHTTAKFENELVAYTDLLEKKDLLFNAQSKVFQIKYRLIASQLILSYYLPNSN